MLTLTIPVAEQAKPRRIDVGLGKDDGTPLAVEQRRVDAGLLLPPPVAVSRCADVLLSRLDLAVHTSDVRRFI